jgi:hypothetical protein
MSVRIGRRKVRRGGKPFIPTPQAASHADSGRMRARKVFAWKSACMMRMGAETEEC